MEHYIGRNLGTTYDSISIGIHKEDVVYINNGILLSHKKDELLTHGTIWIN